MHFLPGTHPQGYFLHWLGRSLSKWTHGEHRRHFPRCLWIPHVDHQMSSTPPSQTTNDAFKMWNWACPSKKSRGGFYPYDQFFAMMGTFREIFFIKTMVKCDLWMQASKYGKKRLFQSISIASFHVSMQSRGWIHYFAPSCGDPQIDPSPESPLTFLNSHIPCWRTVTYSMDNSK